jgi:UDP-glucose 4-epimerase
MGRRENVPAAARLVEGDVRDPAAVCEALDGVDAVLHEAAIVSIRASVEHFVRDADVNLMGTLNLLQQMAGGRSAARCWRRRWRCMPIARARAARRRRPDRAHRAVRRRQAGGRALLAADGRQAGIPATVLRYFNTYGPNQTFTPYVGVITIFIRRLLAGQPVVIFGDGEQRRDFVHVDDIVRANLGVLDAPEASVSGRCSTSAPATRPR